MLINRVAQQLFTAKELQVLLNKLASGDDATLAVAQSARTLILAALWAQNPRPCLFVVAGEEAADRAARGLSAWLGQEAVLRYPARKDYPWSDKALDDASVGARCLAISRLAHSEPHVVVASAAALMRRVPPVASDYSSSALFSLEDEIERDEVVALLVAMGYTDAGSAAEVSEPGRFFVHGDSVDIFASQASSPVRIEFFGDIIDRIRRMVSATGQTIGELNSLYVSPCRELSFSQKTRERALRALYSRAQANDAIASDYEMIEQGIFDPRFEKYLPEFYGTTSSPLEHISADTLVVLAEPRALFDDCAHAFDDISAAAEIKRVSLDGLYTSPQAMDFGSQQRLSFSSLLRVGAGVDAELDIKQPNIAGSDTKLLGRVRQMIADKMAVVFAVPDRGAREALKLSFTDASIAFEEASAVVAGGGAAERGFEDTSCAEGDCNSGGSLSQSLEPPLRHSLVTFVDAPVPAGVVIPAARLGILSVSDLSARMAKHKRRLKRVDPTTVTFAFKPGDYVVHETHGIALFTQIVRQEVAGRQRDYFLLQYADNDKLFVPLEQVNRLTRYIGADAGAPRLTRLNTADWSRATAKARRAAKKLAFDLVDLYTRRSTIVGYAFSLDTPLQAEMEANFRYELTADQSFALADIKADMESARPMDRLLCGDVGFGKTEVALRAAFKCCQDDKQVMLLCPTTILAQQHFDTFFARFTPFDLKVRVLSRFVSAKEQRQALEGFADGSVSVLVGTHRLLSADVNPHDLGLVIIDEEQRFGVQHKEQLKNLREQVDVLTLSATPIPRTMQMAISGVRDMSLILTPPPGRRAVKVSVCEYDPNVVSAAIRQELARKGQVYYVSNRVHTIDDALLRVQEAAPEARVGVAHGQMSAAQVEDVMMAFEAHDIDVLIATTIIENGIDNPRSNTLIIEDSQRLGLAQLYQLKGRVGRSRTQAYAYFMFAPEQPLTEEATARLMAINEFQELGSGMKIAMRDLEIRGAGSLMGAEQHGNLSNVGFDLFTQMLSAAVSEARGENPAAEYAQNEVIINLPADFYLASEYVSDIDRRVLIYRKLALATELDDIDTLQKETEERYGGLPLAALNLFNRSRIRIRALRLGISSVALISGKIICQGIQLPQNLSSELRSRHILYYPKTSKLSAPFQAKADELVSFVLALLTRLDTGKSGGAL